MNTLCRQLRIPAAVLLLVLAPPHAHPEASAGMVTYVWGPLAGLGYDITYPQGQYLYFSTLDGVLTIGYDPDALGQSFIDVSTGRPGFGATAYGLDVAVEANAITLTGTFGHGGVIEASIVGDPGPLDSRGHPESLDSLLGSFAGVGVRPSYHGNELTFSGQTIPEPSSLLTLTIGLGGVWLTWASRRMKGRSRASISSRA